MEIIKTISDTEWLVNVTGRMDSSTAPLLDAVIKEMPNEITALTLDFAGLDYVSSAGLRVILTAQKRLQKAGKLTIRNVNDTIMEIFEVTGFTDILSIE